MTKESEWCNGTIKERARSKEELLNKKSYFQQERDPYDKHRTWVTGAPHNQNRPGTSKQKKPKGPGRKRPKVRCSECGKLLTVKARDIEPSQNTPELVWELPAHKPKTKRKKKQKRQKK